MGKEALLKIIRELSYEEGEFTLASGQKSNFYVDLKNTTLDPKGASLIAKCAFDVLMQSNLKIDAVGGPTLGADPIATALSLEANSQDVYWPAYIVRKESKKHGTDQFVEGKKNLPKNASVVVLEDVVTTGGSSIQAIEKLKNEGLNPVAVLSVVDREAGASETYEKAGLPYFYLLTLSEIKNNRLS